MIVYTVAIWNRFLYKTKGVLSVYVGWGGDGGRRLHYLRGNKRFTYENGGGGGRGREKARGGLEVKQGW
jgi:hypothetical protein